MTSQINTQLAPVLIDARLRRTQHHRSRRRHTYSVPIVREIPPPVHAHPLASTSW